MKVLANDGLEKEGVEKFREAGIEIDATKKLNLVEEIGDYDGLIVRSATKVTREIIEAGKKLKIIGRAGVGYDNVDVQAASEQGIVVKFAPHGNTNSTAEFALSLMFAVSRNIPQAHLSLSRGAWQKKKFLGKELTGKTLGIIGCGRIGQRLAELVSEFMIVLGYDAVPHSKLKLQFPKSKIEYVSKEELTSRSDYVSIHTGGKNMILGEKDIESMKPGAFIINASRPDNIDETALYNALAAGKLGGAAFDVHKNEPKKEDEAFDSRFKGLGNVVFTSHLGASTVEAQKNTGIEIAECVISYLLRGDWHSSVNVGEEITAEERKAYPIFITNEDKPGMFGKIIDTLAKHNINIREIKGRKLGTDNKAQAVCFVHEIPTDKVLDEIRNIPGVYNVKM